jgi:hypothetical protein
MTWMSEAWRVFRTMPRPVSLRDLVDRTGMSANEAQKCICRLKAAECLEFVHGSARTGRYYRPVPGKAPPSDTRGRSEKAVEALRRLNSRPRTLRHRAARPISSITAGRLK